MVNASDLLRTTVFGFILAGSLGQFIFGGNQFQGQPGGGFRGPIGGAGGGGFRGPIGAPGGFRGPIGAPGGFRGPIGGGGPGGFQGQIGAGAPFGGLFQQPRPAPEPPLPKGKQLKYKDQKELVDMLVGVIVKNHERIAHIAPHNYTELPFGDEPVHEASRLDTIKQAIKVHNLLP